MTRLKPKNIEPFFMQTARPVKKRRDQKNRDKHLPFFARINVIHDPVNGNWPKHTDEGIKNNIGIVITKTENIEDGKYLNKRSCP